MGWNQVRWTEAQQVATLMGVDEDLLPLAGVTPSEHFQALRDADEQYEAVTFLGHALPRFEALVWAARIVEGAAAGRELRHADRQALDHSLRWLGDPSDTARRAAMDAAGLAHERSAERMLALGVFFSGGSISDPDLPPIQPGPELAGRFAAAAIITSAGRAEDRAAFFDHALALGEKIAAEGTRALEAA